MYTIGPLVSFSACLLTLFTATSAKFTGCNVTSDPVLLPYGQTNLTVPKGVKPEYIAFGYGTQNYSCNYASKYESTGAIAVLLDASCFFQGSQSDKDTSKSLVDSQSLHTSHDSPLVLGTHYSVKNPNGPGVLPAFDFRPDSQKHNPDAYVVTTKIGGIFSPTNPAFNIDWAELQGISGQGTLAKYVFRVMTTGGQPPATCIPGSPEIKVPYSTIYWFYN